MNNAIETATATTKSATRPYWGEVTDSVIALSGGLPKGPAGDNPFAHG